MLAPLIDRIEVINVPAYLPIEKLNIAKGYIAPALEIEYGFGKEAEQASESDDTHDSTAAKKVVG